MAHAVTSGRKLVPTQWSCLNFRQIDFLSKTAISVSISLLMLLIFSSTFSWVGSGKIWAMAEVASSRLRWNRS
jgi:hypothetical protein